MTTQAQVEIPGASALRSSGIAGRRAFDEAHFQGECEVMAGGAIAIRDRLVRRPAPLPAGVFKQSRVTLSRHAPCPGADGRVAPARRRAHRRRRNSRNQKQHGHSEPFGQAFHECLLSRNQGSEEKGLVKGTAYSRTVRSREVMGRTKRLITPR